MRYFLAAITLLMCACADTGSAPRLTNDLSTARASAASTTQHINSTKTHLETADYKGSRAQKLLDQGVVR